MVDHAHGIFGESASEPGEGGMIRRRLIEGETKKLLEGDPVVDLGFQLRIGVDAEPLLKQEAFHKKQRGIGLVAFRTFADGIISHDEVFNTGPIDDGVDLLHSFDGPVMFQRGKQRDIGEREVGFHFLEAHRSSRMMNLKAIWQINGLMSRDNNIISTCYL
jgi:hypothetical protein